MAEVQRRLLGSVGAAMTSIITRHPLTAHMLAIAIGASLAIIVRALGI
jgi:hypothetical protein